MERTIDISEAIDQSKIGAFQTGIFILCALCLIMDGFDVQARLSCSRDLGAGPASDRRKESRVRDLDTAVGHGAISERPEDKRLQNGMNCRRPRVNRCRLQLISGWLETISL